MKRRKAIFLLSLGLFSGLMLQNAAADDAPAEMLLEEDAEEEMLLEVDEEPSGEVKDEEPRKKSGTAGGTDLEHVKGLIEDNEGQVSKDLSDGLSWEEVLEEAEQQMRNLIPGLTVDPSKYPPANITKNTSTIYWYLVEELELNHAAACGVLANIQIESNFKPMALGDSGTSFGICQWHLGRLTAMMSFCEERKLDYHTLEGQLEYLKYELEGGYKGIYDALKETEDTAEGAYQAAYGFCMGFEKPDQTELRSQRRGNLASKEYFDRIILRPDELEEDEARVEMKILRKLMGKLLPGKEADKDADPEENAEEAVEDMTEAEESLDD